MGATSSGVQIPPSPLLETFLGLEEACPMLKSAIRYKVNEAGGQYIEIPTQKVKPSQTCPSCGHQSKKELNERTHDCPKCGYKADRD
ncbi:MAG: hypothetical protein CV045_12450, partial [Cyanobacteria bacterium M5B4]